MKDINKRKFMKFEFLISKKLYIYIYKIIHINYIYIYINYIYKKNHIYIKLVFDFRN